VSFGFTTHRPDAVRRCIRIYAWQANDIAMSAISKTNVSKSMSPVLCPETLDTLFWKIHLQHQSQWFHPRRPPTNGIYSNNSATGRNAGISVDTVGASCCVHGWCSKVGNAFNEGGVKCLCTWRRDIVTDPMLVATKHKLRQAD
jgi:hypothetical protein